MLVGGCLLYYSVHSLYVLHNIFNTHVFLSFGVENVGSLCFTNSENELVLGHLQKGKPR